MVRHNLYVLLAPGVEQPQSVEPPPLNVQRCYVDVEDDHEARARANARKSTVIAGQSKKRARSSPADKALEDSTKEAPSHGASLVGGRRGRGCECLHAQPSEEEELADNAGGSTPPAKGAQEG
jgi:hypothetical protein